MRLQRLLSAKSEFQERDLKLDNLVLAEVKFAFNNGVFIALSTVTKTSTTTIFQSSDDPPYGSA